MQPIKRPDFDRLIRGFQFAELFNRLGWDQATLRKPILVDDTTYLLTAVAEKSGFYVMHVETGALPALSVRRQINTAFGKVKDFHLILYSDSACTEQRWQFVLRAPNRPPKNIEVGWKTGQDTEALWQRTAGLFFSLDEEDNITIVDVNARVLQTFGANAEKITRKFYDSFKAEHRQFLAFIRGISALADQEWYASLMLNRLMFCYFIQKKGFLDNNLNYLSDRLAQTREKRGANQFYSFYRDFLLLLFHQGLNEPEHKPEVRAEIGQVPYLNGGLFDVHELEEKYAIQIPDEAFEAIFKFFDQWEWHLDSRSSTSAKEINPDVIGFIFEKYINDRANMGAYYTKEDITDYISKNCIIPFLFDQTERNGARLSPCWDLAQSSGDRYIFPSVRHGMSWDYRKNEPLDAPLLLPPDIRNGLDTAKPGLVERRKVWNREAPPEYGLPTEWWREVVERRSRYQDLRQKLDGGEVRQVNDFITLNLDIRTFAQDCLQQTEDPDFLWAFYRSLRSVSVLDPTCGSGAFLFAALNILEPLYEACLDRMEAFVESGESKNSKHFREVFAEAADTSRHPSREYFIYKKIIVHNLYGVDLMREAVEIAKLRLFLKLMSTVQPDRRKPNLGLEPLPDVDFNLRAGNSLVGFATMEEAVEAINQRDLPGGVQGRLVFGEELEVVSAVREKAELIGMAYQRFKDSQLVTTDGAGLKKAKDELNRRLRDLSNTLDGYLAYQYGIDAAKDQKKFNEWKASHTPFHWWAEFYEVLYDEEGRFKGFDVVIGNPPWSEYSAIKKLYTVQNFKTEKCGNLYALCTERVLNISMRGGRFSFIVQLPLATSSRMAEARKLLFENSELLVINTFDDRPGKLFEGLQHCRSTIFLSKFGQKDCKLFTSKYQRWPTENRSLLFNLIGHFSAENRSSGESPFLKYDSAIHSKVLFKVNLAKANFSFSKLTTEYFVFYQEAMQYWGKVTAAIPFYKKNGEVGAPAHGRYIYLKNETQANVLSAVMNSSLFYLYFITLSDCFHLNHSLVKDFPAQHKFQDNEILADLNQKLNADILKNAMRKTIQTKDGDSISYAEFSVNLSKPIIDEIDTVLAEHYGFTEEELDFIINYDIKYRMGRDSGAED
ncbi:MAG: hypothetical protein KIPDCIKN_00622 [Haliscomenobacter sp.]|jgi:hypothetical protein|nr:hypothetical protein [Haliscomenobacter sp.]